MSAEFLDFPLYDVMLPELSDVEGVTAMSLVERPASKALFIKLSEEAITLKLSVNEEKRMVTGVALRADFPIYRDLNGEKFYIRFSAQTIESLATDFMKGQHTRNVSLHHLGDNTDGIYLIESFFYNDNHILAHPEFQGLEKGSWMVTYFIENEAIWADIMSGKINGFSPEVDAMLERVLPNDEPLMDTESLKSLYNLITEIQ